MGGSIGHAVVVALESDAALEAQFQALRYFALDGTDHRSHDEQNSMIRRYIAWRNRHAQDDALREFMKRANVCLTRHYSDRAPKMTPVRHGKNRDEAVHWLVALPTGRAFVQRRGYPCASAGFR